MKIIDEEQDSLRFYYLGNNWKRRVEHIGAKETYDPEGSMICERTCSDIGFIWWFAEKIIHIFEGLIQVIRPLLLPLGIFESYGPGHMEGKRWECPRRQEQ